MQGFNHLILKKNSSAQLEKELNNAHIFKAILDATPIAFNVWDKNMENIMCNSKVLSIFNMTDGNEYLENFYGFSPEFQPNGITSEEMSKINFKKVMDEGYAVFNWLHCTNDGEEIPSEITLIRLDNFGSGEYIVGYVKDLRPDFDDKKDIDYDYYFKDKIPQSVILEEVSILADEWFFSVDIRTGNTHYYGKMWFNGFEDHSKITENDMGKMQFVHQDDIHIYEEFTKNLKNGISKPYDMRFLDDNNCYRYFRVIYKIIYDKDNNPIFAVGKGTDIEEQKIFEERSQKDLLTDCYNKISAENIIAQKLSKNKDKLSAFFIIDIDNFKGINDNLGHYFGDEVLREISKGLKAVFRAYDIVARIGGDEFVVYAENIADLDIIIKKANKILEVYKKTYSGEYADYNISGSIGIAIYPGDGKNYNELYQNADKALSQAKILGKNQYVIYSDELNIGTTRSVTKIENANRIASSFFDYDLIGAIFEMLYDSNGDDDAINTALKFICEKYKADRSYIFETFDNGKTYDNTYEYCNEGIKAEIDNLKGLEAELFTDFLDKAHNNIIFSNNLEETFEHDRAFEIMVNQGILSFAHAQIKKDGIMTFFIGLDDCHKTRVWNEREINSLQYIGKIISIILRGNNQREEIKKLMEINENATHILDSSDNIVYVADVNTYDILYVNKSISKASGGISAESAIGEKCYKVLRSLDEPCIDCTNEKLTLDNFNERAMHYSENNKTYLLRERLIPFNDDVAKLGIITDISVLKKLEEELKERLQDEEFLSNCVEMLHSGTEPRKAINTLLEAVLTYYDAERSYIFEMSECGDYISNTFEFCKEGVDAYINILKKIPVEELSYLIDRCVKNGAFHLSIEDVTIDKDSAEYKLMMMQEIKGLTMSAIITKDKGVTGFVGVDNPLHNKEKTSIIHSVAKFIASFLDETELINKLNKLSYYDTLTNAKNRHSYTKELKVIDTIDITSLGVAYIDILGLKAINDEHGTIYGDDVLRRLANTLQTIFKDSVYRVGGDEFIVLKENIDEISFENSISELRNKMQDEDFKISVGYTWNENLISGKKGALHEGEKYSRILSENLDMEILNGKFIVQLQPQVELKTGKVIEAEALIRRIGAKGVIQAPINFIPFYEKEGMISKIDKFVLETVCKTLREWQDKGYETIKTISVNCSRMTISESGIVKTFSDICRKYGISESKIIIEITETINGINENALSKIIEGFKSAGFLVSLDDFGCGYSNLNSLITSDFDEIKIDKKLVDDIHRNDKSKALTELAISLCSRLGDITSIAEGVELLAQSEVLKKLGCKKAQGYFFDKPIFINDFYEKYVKQ